MANANAAVIAQAKKDYEAAKKAGNKAGMEAAHAAAERERAKDGYSGGADGSLRISLAGNSGNNSSGSSSGGNSGGSSGGSGRRSGNTSSVPAAAAVRYETQVWTPEGTTVGGYIENGKTYLNDGTRISDGYSVRAKDGTIYTMENGVGRASSLDELTNKIVQKKTQNIATQRLADAEEEYRERMAEAQRQMDLSTDAGVKQAINALNKQKDEVGDTMDKAAREAYIAKMQGQKNLSEQYAASGITGGPTESGRINLENAYANNITDINNQRRASLDDINSAIENAQLTGDITKAQNAASIAQQAANTYLELAQNRANLEYAVAKDADSEAEKQLQYYLTYIDAYADDPQAEIDRLMSQGVSATDPRVMALKALINNQAAEAEALAHEEELARIKAANRGGSGGGGNTTTTAATGTTSATGNSGGGTLLTSFPAEDKAVVKMFSQMHKTYTANDVQNDYNAGFLTDRAYQLLMGALKGNAEYKAKVAEYSK